MSRSSFRIVSNASLSVRRYKLQRREGGDADPQGRYRHLQFIGAGLKAGRILGAEGDLPETILDRFGGTGQGQFAKGVKDEILDFVDVGYGIGVAAKVDPSPRKLPHRRKPRGQARRPILRQSSARRTLPTWWRDR